MSKTNSILDIQLLDRKLQLKAPLENVDDLREAAYYLDGKMREIRSSGAATGNERIALIAALNLAHDFILSQKERDIYLDSMSSRIKLLQDKVDDVIAPKNADLFEH